MNIKPGKWRMRNGECAVVEFRTGAQFLSPWIGYREKDGVFLTWDEDGKFKSSFDDFDLIEPWTDKPVVDWSAIPAWAKWVAMDDSGVWWWHAEKPTEDVLCWYCDSLRGVIPKDFAPSFNGNWSDSLVERPSA